MAVPFIDGPALDGLLSMGAAIDALEAAFARSQRELPDRQHLDVGGGDLLLMPAWSETASGVKLITVAPDNPKQGLPLIHGVYVLFEKPSLQPVALFDAAPLTALRTAAVSAVATRHLARADSSRLVIFGSGVQAGAHLIAMREVRDLTAVHVVGLSADPVQALVERARSLGMEASPGTAGDVADADLVCTCTTSTQPLFDGSRLRPGTHVNAIGSYKPGARELDDLAIGRASVVVDTGTALRESGDLVIPLQSGSLDEKDVELLADIVASKRQRAEDEITIFKSVGAAFQDLAVAEAAAARI